MTSDLERAWAVLSPPKSEDFESFPLDLAFDGRPCRVALDPIGGRHLLVPASTEAVSGDSKPTVLGLAIRKLSFGGVTALYVDVSCMETDLYAEFDDVVADVLEQIKQSDRPAGTAISTVARWRKLFASKLVRGLSKTAKLGLFAELTMLSHLLDADPSFPIEDWRGPLREPHDFEAPVKCIEVKALGIASDAVVIHGLDQLDRHDGRPLDLVLVTVMEDPDGMSIAELVDDVSDSVSPVRVLRARLAAAGWARNPDHPDTDRFSINEVLRVSIDAESPRLVPSSLVAGALPEGLHDLSYQLDVEALLPFASSAALADVAEEAIR